MSRRPLISTTPVTADAGRSYDIEKVRVGSQKKMHRRSLSRGWIFLLLLGLLLLTWSRTSTLVGTAPTPSNFATAGNPVFVTEIEDIDSSEGTKNKSKKLSTDSRRLMDPLTTLPLVLATSNRYFDKDAGRNREANITTLRPHFFTTLSGCRMARWILPITETRPEKRDCFQSIQSTTSTVLAPRLLTNQSLSNVQPNDTIYVTYDQLDIFVEEIIPYLKVEVVLLSGQRAKVWSVPAKIQQGILDASCILKWFSQNLPTYHWTGINSTDTMSFRNHRKLTSFPYGLKQLVRHEAWELANPQYRHAFLEGLTLQVAPRDATATSTTTALPSLPIVWSGYVTVSNNPKERENLLPAASASSQYLPPTEYYQKVSSVDYILSPNGDRPETYRHYEALGLGAAPLTQLEFNSFAHFQGSGLIFGTSHQTYTTFDPRTKQDARHVEQGASDLVVDPLLWKDPGKLSKVLPRRPVVNRNLVLEEYWMEYVDWKVRRSLNWWNPYPGDGGLPEGPTTTQERLRHLQHYVHDDNRFRGP